MIGKPVTGASFFGCLQYCLKDKKELSEYEKLEKSILEQVQHKDRAEVLDYNNCFGDLHDLTRQMINVSKLNQRVEKPVFHFSIRPAPGDVLTRVQFTEIGHRCAKEFGLENNQYVIVLHKDTKQPHIHIVANRVDFDGKLVTDAFSIKRMQTFCRRIESEYHLKQVISARSFLPEELRHIPRQNIRLNKLKKDIQHTLEKVTTYQQFEKAMQSLGYKVLKGRGICFIDEKKVRIKGSEVGFSLSNIERILAYKQQIIKKEELLKASESFWKINRIRENQRTLSPAAKILMRFNERDQMEEFDTAKEVIEMMKEIVKQVIHDLLTPDYCERTAVSPEFLRELLKNKKKKRKRLHL